MMIGAIKEGDAVRATVDGDVVEVAVRDVVWRIRVTLEADAVVLRDEKAGDILHRGNIADIGIARTGTRYRPAGEERAKMLAGFVVAWIALEPRH